MIQAMIIEDEKLAADHLKKLIADNHPEIHISKTIDSVQNAIEWFRNEKMPELVFMDIQLADGLCFEIFDHVQITSPIIFTTAYDEYTLKAFKVNSIDYLLKPICKEDLDHALYQFRKQNENILSSSQGIRAKVDEMYKYLTGQYKTRFVVNAGVHIRSFETDKITCFYSAEKSTFLQDENGRAYDIAYPLDQLEKIVDPGRFFRINRKYIINRNAIEDILMYTATKLKLKVKHINDMDLIISRSRLKDFRNWLEK